jgi:hypothetical protein
MVASLTGELGAGLRLGQGLGQMASQRQQQRLGAQQQELLGGLRRQSLGLGGATPQQQQQASLELLSADPVGSKKFFDSFSSLTTRDQELTKERNSKIGLAGSNLLQFDDSQLNAATLQAARAFANSGDEDSANRALQLSQLPPEELRPRLEALTTQSRDIEQVIASGEKKAKALSEQSQKEIDTDLGKSKDQFDQIDKLRTRVTAVSKEFTKVRDANNRVEAIFGTNAEAAKAAQDAFLAKASNSANAEQISQSTEAFGDMALVFNFMKMLDPGSTVREGEFASATNTAGMDDKVRNMYNNALKGTRLNDTQRAALRKQATGLFTAAKTQNDKDLSRFKKSATAFELPFDQIFEEENKGAIVTGEELKSAGGVSFTVK